MFSFLFNTIIYNPLYNGLVFLMAALPWADVGVVVIVFTIVVRLILFPLSRRAVQTQYTLKEIEPELQVIKTQYKNDTQTQALKTMELYKARGVNPFASIFLVLLQLPVIFALYFIFLRGGFPTIHAELLYSFIHAPAAANTLFLGLIEMTQKSAVLSVLTGVTQLIQAQLSVPAVQKKGSGERTFGSDLAHSMNIQMRYVLPVVVGVISYSLSSLIALYWTTSNLFTVGQELVMRRRRKQATTQ